MTEEETNKPVDSVVADAIARGRAPSPGPTLGKTAQAFADKAKDLQALRDAVVDAAAVGGTLWVSYLGTLFYLAIAAGAVTHKDLFFEHPVKLPFLGVDLSLVSFFALGPALFLIIHAYVLLHFLLLAGKVAAFHRELETQIAGDSANEATRASLRRQLPSNIFIQFLAGPRDVRFGVTGWMLRVIAWISLVFAPVLLLVFFQLRFLPYHLEGMTWWHRMAVLLDIVLLWWVWPKIAKATLEPIWRHRAVELAVRSCVVLPLGLVFAVATFPGEWLHTAWPPVRFIPVDDTGRVLGVRLKNLSFFEKRVAPASLHELLVDGAVDEVQRRPTSPFANVLVLPRLYAYDPAKFDADKTFGAVRETISLRGRNLQGAVLIYARLHRADLTGAVLGGALLEGAQLQGASLERAQLQGASLYLAQLQGASLGGAQLQGASLEGAQLQNAWLFQAQLQGASLALTGLQGALLGQAQLQGALLGQAQLQGASLERAQLQGALLYAVCLFRTTAAGAEIAATRVIAPRVEARNPTAPDEHCDGSAERFAALREEVGRAEPAGERREAALKRWDQALLPNPPEKRDGEDAMAARWLALASNPPDDAAFVAARQRLGCDPDSAPHVARGLLQQMSPFDPEGWMRSLAGALLDPACAGAAWLTAEERARLARIRDFQPPASPSR